jgi:hypothetical protein
MADALPGMRAEAGGWVRLGKRPGPVMWSYGFMRVERVLRGWRAWDVLRVPELRPTHPTTIHKRLRDAKEHCEAIVGDAS